MLRAWLWLWANVVCKGQDGSCDGDSCPDHMALLAKPALRDALSKEEALQYDDDQWYKVVESANNLDWKYIPWPYLNREWVHIARSYPYGGDMLVGLLYQTCIIQVANQSDPIVGNSSNLTLPPLPADVGVDALGKVLSGLAGAIKPGGKVLSGLIAGAFSLFGHFLKPEEVDIKEALNKLYEKIMAEVRGMFDQLQLQTELQNARKALAHQMTLLRELPSDFIKFPDKKIFYLETIRISMSGKYYDIFNSDTCFDVQTLKPKSSPACTDFQMHGVFFQQLQFLLSDMSLYSQVGLFIEGTAKRPAREGRDAQLAEMRRKLKEYLPLLKISFETYKSWSPNCGYVYPKCFGCCGPNPGPGCPYDDPNRDCKKIPTPRGPIFGPCYHCLDHPDDPDCGPAYFQADGYVISPYSVEAMSKELGCRTNLPDNLDGQRVNRQDFCAGNDYNMCTAAQIDGLRDRFRQKLEDTFSPVLEGLEILSEEIKEAKEQVDELIASTEFSRRRAPVHRRRDPEHRRRALRAQIKQPPDSSAVRTQLLG